MGANFKVWWQASVQAHPRRAAVVYMLLSTLGFAMMNICVRFAAETMQAPLIVTLRNLTTMLILLPFVAPNRFAAIRTTRIRQHFWRSLIGAVGMLSWTYSLTLMPLVHATALSFTTPLLVTLFAMLALKEKADARHWLCLLVGFAGTLIILRPNAADFDMNSLWVLFATSSWAVTSLFIKSLSRTEPPIRMVFYMNLFMFFIALPLGATHWQTPTAPEAVALLGMCLFSIFMHFTMVKAYALAPVTTLMPLDFSRLIYTSILAYLFFGETSDHWTWIGSAVIVTAAVIAAPRRMKEEPTVE